MYYAHFIVDSNVYSVYDLIVRGKRDMRADEIEKIIKEDGWYLKNQKGSHPFHRGDLDKRTAKSILKQAGLE